MAVQTVVSVKEREKIRQLLRKVEDEKGRLSLAMLAGSSLNLVGRWSFVVSAPWMDTAGPREVVSYLSSYLERYLDKKTLAAIDRVFVLPSKDPLVQRIPQLLNDFLGIDVSTHEAGFYMTNSAVEDWNLPQAFVFLADRDVNGKVTRSANKEKVALH